MLFEDFFPDYDLGAAFDYAHGEFADDFESYWGLNGQQPEHLDKERWNRIKQVDELAVRLSESACQLIRADRSYGDTESLRRLEDTARSEWSLIRRRIQEHAAAPDEESREIARQLSRFLMHETPKRREEEWEVLRTRFALTAWREFGESPTALGDHARHLVTYLMRDTLQPVSHHLRRVAACYIRRLIPEFLVMSRAVLETVLTQALSGDVANPRSDPAPLSELIKEAKTRRYLDAEAADAAFRVKDLGNRAAHGADVSEVDPDRVLHDLNLALNRLGRRLTAPERSQK